MSRCCQAALTCGFSSCTLSLVRTIDVGRERAMADLAYALLLIVSFLVLGLTVRGLEKL